MNPGGDIKLDFTKANVAEFFNANYLQPLRKDYETQAKIRTCVNAVNTFYEPKPDFWSIEEEIKAKYYYNKRQMTNKNYLIYFDTIEEMTYCVYWALNKGHFTNKIKIMQKNNVEDYEYYESLTQKFYQSLEQERKNKIAEEKAKEKDINDFWSNTLRACKAEASEKKGTKSGSDKISSSTIAPDSIYCDCCKTTLKKSSYKGHLTSLKHKHFQSLI